MDHWFNHECTHESIDDLTPAEIEQAHYAARNRLVPTGAETPSEMSGNTGAVQP